MRQQNNSNSNPLLVNKPAESPNPLQKSATEPSMAFSNFCYGEITPLSAPPSKSPKAAPRTSPPQNTGLYENVEVVLNPSRCSGYSSDSRDSSESDLIHYQLETIKSLDMIPEDLTTLSVPALCDCLHLFELHNAAHKMRQHQIDGQFFMIMTEKMFKDTAFNFSDFELLKLRRLRDGWRPKL